MHQQKTTYERPTLLNGTLPSCDGLFVVLNDVPFVKSAAVEMLVRKTQGFFSLVNVLCSFIPSPVGHDVSSDHPLTELPISAAKTLSTL